jgi:hypothetical protein
MRVVTVSYDATTEPVPVRAFALDITVDSGAIITAVDDSLSSDYTIYPGSIIIVDGNVTNYGTAVCANSYPGTLPGLNSGGVTVEMGALYDVSDSNLAPGPSGVLFSFTVDKDCCVTIAENAIRGGVVSEDYTTDVDVNAPGYCVVSIPDCFPTDPNYATQRADYLAYQALGWDASCWCAPPYGSGYQCEGDADGATYGFKQFRVYTPDFDMLVANWGTAMAAPNPDPNLSGPNPCADFDHKPYGFKQYRVYTPDFDILVAKWGMPDSDPNMLGTCPVEDQ